MKRKPKEKKEVTLNIVQYTEDSFYFCYPDATEEDFENYLLQDLKHMVRQTEKQQGIRVNSIRKVVIDEEYFEWLEQADFEEENSASRIAYANQLRDEDVLRLWKENDMEACVLPFVVPFVVYGGQTVLPVSNTLLIPEKKEHILNLLANATGLPKNHLFLHKELLRGDVCTEEWVEEQFCEAAERHFEGEKKVELPRIPFISKQTDQTMMYRFLPVAINDIEPAILTRKEFDAKTWVDKMLPKASLTKWGESVYAELGDIRVLPISALIPPFAIQEMVENFNEELRKDAEKVGKIFRNAK